jgi:hypothetical protein
MNEFSLSVRLSMMDQYAVAEALEAIATKLNSASNPTTIWKTGSIQTISDYNGNLVGTWSIT